jgi:hypothetical protein
MASHGRVADDGLAGPLALATAVATVGPTGDAALAGDPVLPGDASTATPGGVVAAPTAVAGGVVAGSSSGQYVCITRRSRAS